MGCARSFLLLLVALCSVPDTAVLATPQVLPLHKIELEETSPDAVEAKTNTVAIGEDAKTEQIKATAVITRPSNTTNAGAELATDNYEKDNNHLTKFKGSNVVLVGNDESRNRSK